MKKFDLLISILLIPLDYIMLLVAGFISYTLRYQELVTQVRPVFFDVSFSTYVSSLALVAVLALIVLAWSGLYSIKTSIHSFEEFKQVFLAVSSTFLVVIITIFLRRELFSSRFIILTGWVLAIVFVWLGRWLLYRLKGLILSQGLVAYHYILIGSGPAHDRIKEYYASHKNQGYKLIGEWHHFSEATAAEILATTEPDTIDEIILTEPEGNRAELLRLMQFSSEHHLSLRYVASLQDSQLVNFELSTLAGYPIVRIKRTPLEGWGRVVKRLFDAIGAAVLIIVLLPLGLLISLCIVVDSSGPVLVRLARVGQYGQTFRLFKFRSMVKDAHQMKKEILQFNERQDGPLFKMKNDPRITRVGTFLRRSSLDELPQLFNVLLGTMSLVGPRPHEPEEVSRYTSQYKKLLNIKPGMTGAAQVSGRSKLLFEDEAKIDIYYIENWSLLEDIKILAKTPAAVINYKNVY
jgi:exopolysaccharide biosynthesis polyprenyl glycosylphosphotransferase